MRLEGWRTNLPGPVPGVRRIVSIAPSNTEILHALGLNHVNVTFLHNGRSERPTIVAGEVIKEAFA